MDGYCGYQRLFGYINDSDTYINDYLDISTITEQISTIIKINQRFLNTDQPTNSSRFRIIISTGHGLDDPPLIQFSYISERG